MKRIINFMLVVLVSMAVAETLENAFNSAESGVLNGVSYDKLVNLKHGTTYTGSLHIHSDKDSKISVMINGNGAVIDMQENDSIAFAVDQVESRFDVFNCVIKGRFIVIENKPTYSGESINPIVNIWRNTFYKCHRGGVITEDTGENKIVIKNNIFANNIDDSWTSEYGGWLPTGTAVTCYRYASGSQPEGTGITITDNLSYMCTYTNGEKSGDFWATCVSCGGGPVHSTPLPYSGFSGDYSGNVTGVDPLFQNAEGNDFVTSATEAEGKGCLHMSNINDELIVAKDVSLSQNYPNPFNPTTTINFDLKKDSQVKLSVYDSRGMEVANLVNGKLKSGNHRVGFNGASVAAGIYYYRLVAGSEMVTKKMILLK